MAVTLDPNIKSNVTHQFFHNHSVPGVIKSLLVIHSITLGFELLIKALWKRLKVSDRVID